MTDTPSDLVCIPVPQNMVDLVWDEAKPFLEAAVKTARGKCDISDVRVGLEDGTYLLWVVMDGKEIIAAITTRIIEYARCKAMALDWIGGKRIREWIAMSNQMMVEHARLNGCTHLEGYGREAWIKLNGKYGWKEDYTAFRLEV